MKPQQLAKLLNISPVTLRHWCLNEFGEFLSPSARGQKGAKRSFGEHDSRILAWVASMKAQNIPIADIVAALRASQSENWRTLPPMPSGMAEGEPIAVIPREAAQERLTAIQERYELQVQGLVKERDELKAQVVELKSENAELRKKKDEITEQILDLNRRLTTMLEKEQRRRK